MELAHIAANKNTVPGDVSAMVPGGIRMGKRLIQDLVCLVDSDLAQGIAWMVT